MGARLLLAAMLVGTPTVMVLGARDDAPAAPAQIAPTYTEKPWLSREATAQLIAPGGMLGPLFAGVILGGSEPPAPIRERIAAFAREHDIDIDLNVDDGMVTAVTIGVTYDGGYGYQGADVLAFRMQRPNSGVCCVCGPDTWYNDWGIGFADGTYLHARVNVNRVEARWVAGMSTTEVLAFAESLVGLRMSELRTRFGDRMFDRYRDYTDIEIPYANTSSNEPLVIAHGDYAMKIMSSDDGHVGDVSIRLRGWDDEGDEANKRIVLARYGRPRRERNEHSTWWSWRRNDYTISASTYQDVPSEVSFTTHVFRRELDARY